jgi:ATP-binding protein involved in chromosome partitioning
MASATTPTAIEQAGPATLRIRWGDGHESLYPVRPIRLACRCAHCIEETTGVPLLDPDTIPDDVRPVNIATVGRYAIRIEWSDGHDTGIYPYDHLRALCPCCTGPHAHAGHAATH